MNILSIQSHVAYGHVGNAAATFPMQRLGHEVWPIHTVQFSNHTGYGAWRGQVFDAGLIVECVDGIADRGVLGQCDGVLSGYMGSADTGAAILGAVARVRDANPQALYCCDPVIGDIGRGIFVRPGIAEFMRDKAVPAADVVTPNQFELDLLCGFGTGTEQSLRRGVASVHAGGPKAVLVTSYQGESTPSDAVDLVASDRWWPLARANPKARSVSQRCRGCRSGPLLRLVSGLRLGARGFGSRSIRYLRLAAKDACPRLARIGTGGGSRRVRQTVTGVRAGGVLRKSSSSRSQINCGSEVSLASP